jgi:hypothetical protein
MINLITYGDCKYAASKVRLYNEATATGWFDTVAVYGQEDLDNDFKDKFENILQNHRGGGYWIWKAYIIKKQLDKIKDDDILIYLDAGCSINSYGENRFNEYIEMLNKNDDGVISFQMDHHEKVWTTKEIFQHFSIDPCGEMANTGQIMATIIIIKKNANSIKLVNVWVETLYNNPLLFTDCYNKSQNPCFKDNRHDQSIFSVIRKMHSTILLTDETYFTPFGSEESLKYPFWATRNRS